MKAVLTICLFFCVTESVFSQAWVWEKSVNAYNNSIVTDRNDNIIILGQNGNATVISKFTKDGLMLWSNRLTKAAAFNAGGTVVTDKKGNIYAYTNGFDSINSQFTGIKSSGVTKFGPNGNLQWHTFYTVSTSELPIQIDDSDNLYIGSLGYFSVTPITLGSITITTGSGFRFMSLGSISSSGAARWVRAFAFTNIGGFSLLDANNMSLSGNTLYVTGYSTNLSLQLDNGINLTNNRCSSWLAAINCSTAQSKWGKAHSLIYYCSGLNCNCSLPAVNASYTSGKLMLINNLEGAFVFRPLDTIASFLTQGLSVIKPYYTIYDTAGNSIKGKVFEEQQATNPTRIISRNNFFFLQVQDSLIKIDTAFNRLWRITLPVYPLVVENIYAPPNSNDIVVTYRNYVAGGNYIAKMVDSAGVISGRTYADWNNDGVYTSADTALSNILITTNNSALRSISGNDSGRYFMYSAPGAYTLNANSPHPYYQFLPATHTATITQYTDTIRGKDFRLRPLFNFIDVAVNFSALDNARPGHIAHYKVTVKNFGPVATPIDVGLKLPPLTTYNTITGATVTVNAPDSITIAMGNVNPWQTKTALLFLNVSTSAVAGDKLRYYPRAYPYATDTLKYNNDDTLIQIVRASFDPNEKEVNANKQVVADTSKALVYTIHFQNTGTDTAFYVRIADTLSAKLNANSFNFIDASHTVTTEIKNNVLNFIFNPIALPDSTHNEPLSHGFVKFSIKPASPVNIADTIYNRSAIYFDFNSPVITNQAKTWFSNSPLPVLLKSFVAEKQTNYVLLKFVTGAEPGFKNFIIERSADGINFNAIGTIASMGDANTGRSYSFMDLSPKQGINFYRLKMVDIDGRFTYSWIVIVQFSDKDQQVVKVFPNPANDNLYINFSNTVPAIFSCRLLDAAGKTVWGNDINTATRNTVPINTAALAEGIYFVTVKNGEISYRQKIVIKH